MRNNHAFSVGVGVDWRNYRITGDQRFVQNNRVVTFDSYPANSIHSSLASKSSV